jgi:hypothetical protein
MLQGKLSMFRCRVSCVISFHSFYGISNLLQWFCFSCIRWQCATEVTSALLRGLSFFSHRGCHFPQVHPLASTITVQIPS